MTITVVCKCGEILDVPEEHAGKHVVCPECRRLTKVSGEEICLLSPGETNVAGVWRKGDLLVVEQGALLPSRCVKSNAPVNNSFLQSRLSWQSENFGCFFLAGPWFYLIFRHAYCKRATVYIGLSRAWKLRRRLRMMAGLLITLLGIVLVALAFGSAGNFSDSQFLGCIASGFPMIGIGCLVAYFLRHVVRAEKITSELVFLRGVHPQYLAMLPEFPGE